MERKRMNQAQLATAIGVSRSAVNSWINDRAYPLHSVGALEEVLGVSLEDEGSYEPISDDLRRKIVDALPGDIEAQRRVIGLLEETLQRTNGDDFPAEERPAR